MSLYESMKTDLGLITLSFVLYELQYYRLVVRTLVIYYSCCFFFLDYDTFNYPMKKGKFYFHSFSYHHFFLEELSSSKFATFISLIFNFSQVHRVINLIFSCDNIVDNTIYNTCFCKLFTLLALCQRSIYNQPSRITLNNVPCQR